MYKYVLTEWTLFIVEAPEVEIKHDASAGAMSSGSDGSSDTGSAGLGQLGLVHDAEGVVDGLRGVLGGSGQSKAQGRVGKEQRGLHAG